MEYNAIRVLLRTAPTVMEAEGTISKNLWRRKQRAFLQVVHEILTRRNDKSEVIDEWARCLLELDEGDFEHLDDFPKHVLQLVAFQQYREKKLSVLDRDSENPQPLLIFLRRPPVVRIINGEVGADSFVPTEVDWMALNMLCAHNLLNAELFNHIIMLASGPRGLSGILEMTPQAWRAEIGYIVRQKVENILFILFKILSIDPSKHDLILTLCGKSFIHITTRLEEGVRTSNEDWTGTSEALDAGFFSSSEEEEEEGEAKKEQESTNALQIHSTTLVKEGYDSDDSDEYAGDTNAHLQIVRRLLAAEGGLPAYRSSWCNLCLSSVMILYRRVVEEKRAVDAALVSSRGSTGPDVASAQGVSETVAMLNSRTWQRQLMSIGGLVDFLIRKQKDSS